MHTPKCSIRKKGGCGNHIRFASSPDNPYLGGDHFESGELTCPRNVTWECGDFFAVSGNDIVKNGGQDGFDVAFKQSTDTVQGIGSGFTWKQAAIGPEGQVGLNNVDCPACQDFPIQGRCVFFRINTTGGVYFYYSLDTNEWFCGENDNDVVTGTYDLTTVFEYRWNEAGKVECIVDDVVVYTSTFDVDDTYRLVAGAGSRSFPALAEFGVNDAVFNCADEDAIDVAALPNLLQWVIGDAVAGADATVVATWQDQTANNNDYTQSDAAKRPIKKLNISNGHAVVRFDTTDGMTTVLNNTASPFTIFIVYSYRSTSSAFRRAICDALNWLIGPYNNKHQWFDGSTLTEGPAVVQNVFVTATVMSDDTPITAHGDFYVNGTLIGTRTPPTAGMSDPRLGSSNPFSEPLDGDIAEILYYGDPLTSVQIAQVHTYLRNKYGHY